VLIPSIYATSPRTRSLRPVRVPSDQNTRWRLSFHFSTNKRQEFLVSTHLPHKIRFWGWMFSPRRRTGATFVMTISRIGMQTHVYVCIFLIRTFNHANIIICVYVRFTFKWNVDCCWCMDCILMMWGNRFADYRHEVCQVYIYITVVLGLKSWVGIKLLVWILRIIDNCVVVINFRMVRTRQGTRTELPFLERRGGSQVA
jgi:hypothetical protein